MDQSNDSSVINNSVFSVNDLVTIRTYEIISLINISYVKMEIARKTFFQPFFVRTLISKVGVNNKPLSVDILQIFGIIFLVLISINFSSQSECSWSNVETSQNH